MNEPIQDKTLKPPGLLPKNVQSWLLIGLAVLMVVIMWLTGGKKPQPNAKANAPLVTAPPPLEVNETKIEDLQNRIQELQREQLVAQSALSQQSRVLGSPAPDAQQAQQASSPNSAPSPGAEDAIQEERKKRAYLSLFSSNVALTYRKTSTNTQTADADPILGNTPPTTANPLPAEPDAAQLAQALSQMLPTRPAQPAVPPEKSSAEINQKQKEETGTPAAVRGGVPDTAAGKTYIVFEGTILETVLINRLEGQFAGPVECLLTTDVYSHDRQHLLLPAGTKLLGETRKVENSGQTRLAVVFHRMVMPDGYSASLDRFTGLDQIGDTGLRDQVNNHYLRIFGVSLAIGALGAVAEAGSGGGITQNGSDLMRQGFAQSTAQSSAQILDRFLNILPTVTIREGHRVKVYLSGDLALPDYNNHTMPSDL